MIGTLLDYFEGWKVLLLNAIFNPTLLFLLVFLFFVGRFFGKLTRRITWWKFLIFAYFGFFVFPSVRDAGWYIGGIFVAGIFSNHLGTFFSALAWAGSLGDVIYALRYKRAYNDIRRREKELEERERKLNEQMRAQARSQGESEQQRAWQEQAKARRNNHGSGSAGQQKSGSNEKARTGGGSSSSNSQGNRQQSSQGQKTQTPPQNDVRARHLRTLGLDPSKQYTKEAMKKAYRKAIMKAHPDAGGSDSDFIAVSNAWEWLKNSSVP